VAAGRWTELPGRLAHELARELRGLRGNERPAVGGVIAIVVSLLLPWYGVPFAGGLVKTGFGAFGFAEGAILLTCAAVVFLALQVGGGYVPPRPLREWGLFVTAGVWICLILAFRMVYRPKLSFDLQAVSVDATYELRYGVFVALAGALTIVATGIRARRREARR
jgi:hypothetical protein